MLNLWILTSQYLHIPIIFATFVAELRTLSNKAYNMNISVSKKIIAFKDSGEVIPFSDSAWKQAWDNHRRFSIVSLKPKV